MLWYASAIALLFITLPAQADYNIGFLPAMTFRKGNGAGKYKNLGKQYAGAIQVAMDNLAASSNYSALSINYTYTDNEFDTLVSLKAMTDMYMKNVDIFLGPENTCVHEARLAAAWNLPMIGFRCLDSILSDKKIFPTFARTVPGTAKVSKSILSVMKEYHWTTFAVIMENTTEWKEASLTLGKLAAANNMSVSANESYSAELRPGMQGQDHWQEELCPMLEKTRSRTRVYVFFGSHDALVGFMRCLVQLEKYKLYAVIHVREFDNGVAHGSPEALLRLTSYWYQRELDSSILPVFRQLITLEHRTNKESLDYQKFETETREYLHSIFEVPSILGITMPVSTFAAKVYDGVMIYARALKETVEKGGDPRNGSLVMTRIFNRTYQSIQGFQDRIDENGDAEGAYKAVAVITDSSNPVGYSVQAVGTFSESYGTPVPDYQMIKPMDWISGKAPLSEPKCGFHGEKCPPPNINKIYMVIVAVFAGFVLILVIFVVRRQYTYRKKIDSLLWKIDRSEIEFVNTLEFEGHQSPKDGHDAPWQFLEDDFSGNTLQQKPLPTYVPVGYYKNAMAALKYMGKRDLEMTRSMKKHLHQLREIHHENVNKFIGACIDPAEVIILTQYCSRGSLEEVLMTNRDLFLEDSMMQYSLIKDLVKGLLFIHQSAIGCHGNLKSTKCLVDSRLVLQVSGFGLHHFRQADETEQYTDPPKYFKDRLWRAPELLRDPNIRGTQKGDVYAFGIILHEILGMMGPWGGTTGSDSCIVQKVKDGKADHPFRPNMSILCCEEYLKRCMEECWCETCESRPDFHVIQDRRLKPLNQSLGSNILENMVQRIERYTTNLEALVDERTQQLNTEKKKTEKLLLRMLPRTVAEDLKRGKPVQASYYNCVTIYFSDIVGFTKLCSESDPYQIVKFLNDLYTKFDGIIDNYDVYKVETIGDAYMVVSGLPKPNGDNHAGEIASMSLHLLAALKNFKIHHKATETLKLRIGLHSGPVVGGVVGMKMPRYCLFGDTVNTASRMESNGLPLMVHCSEQCKEILDKLGGYYVEKRGLVEMKGKGQVLTYWLKGEDSFQRIKRLSETVRPFGIDSTCTSARSSFNDNLHLMPNGFRRVKLTRDHFSLDEFKLKPNWKHALRRGSMPVNEYRRGSIGLLSMGNRRGSSPIHQKKNFEIKGSGWELNEDDERRPMVESVPSSDETSTTKSPTGEASTPQHQDFNGNKPTSNGVEPITSQHEVVLNGNHHTVLIDRETVA